METTPPRSHTPSSTFIGLAAVAASLYALLLTYMAVNIPYQDDIHDVLEFLLDYQHATTAWQALHILFAPHNVHMAVFPRLVYLADYTLTGNVNFIALAAIANFALLLIALLVTRLLIDRRHRGWLLALASLLIFTPRAYDLMLFPMSSISFYYATLFSLLAIICLQQPTPQKLIAAIVFASFAALTNASGQLAMLMGLAYLFCQWLLDRNHNAHYWLGWLLFSCLLGALLYLGRDNTAMPEALIKQAETIGATPLHYTTFFLALLGSALSFQSTALAMLTGAIVLALVLLLCLEKFRQGKIDASVFISVYFLCCAAAITYGRARYVAVDYALTSRYSYQSTFLLVCLVIMLINRQTGIDWRAKIIACAVAIGFCVANYACYLGPLETHVNKRIQLFNAGKYSTFFHPLETTNGIVHSAIEHGIYTPPEKPLKKKDIAHHIPGN